MDNNINNNIDDKNSDFVNPIDDNVNNEKVISDKGLVVSSDDGIVSDSSIVAGRQGRTGSASGVNTARKSGNSERDNAARRVNGGNNSNNNANNNGNAGVILVVSILLSFVCGAIAAYLIVSNSNVAVESVVKNITTSELVETSISTSVDKVYGSTVIIMSYNDGKQVSTGTGFVYKKDKNKAYIMTNNHVIDKADSVEVEFNDKDEKIKAEIIGGDAYSDIAVLTIAADKVEEVVELGHSEGLKLGDTIFTVGSPMGITYKGTVTKGIVSGKERMIEVSVSNSSSTDYYMNVIQIDAAVNPGNSGGPLCDVSGKVVGIISLKIVQDEVEGMGFAIPIEDAMEYAKAIEEGGEVERPYIGISMVDLTQEYYLWQNRIVIPEGVDEGIAVMEVVKGSPADKAKLEKGDIIVKLGGSDTGSLAEFRYELYKHKIGDKLEVTYYRDGKKKTTSITLGKNEE